MNKLSISVKAILAEFTLPVVHALIAGRSADTKTITRRCTDIPPHPLNKRQQPYLKDKKFTQELETWQNQTRIS
jgi:hypothetical protein